MKSQETNRSLEIALTRFARRQRAGFDERPAILGPCAIISCMHTAIVGALGLLTAAAAMGVFRREDEPTLSAAQRAELLEQNEDEEVAIAEYEAKVALLRSESPIKE